MNCKNTTKEIAILLCIAFATAFTFNYFSPMGIALIGQWDESQGVITAKTKNDVVEDDLVDMNDFAVLAVGWMTEPLWP